MWKRSLKQMKYGKFAASFYKISTGEAFRVTDVDANSNDKNDETIEELINRFKNASSDELFNLQPIEIKLDENDLPGKPYERDFCPICNEKLMDGKYNLINGKTICKSCSNGSYYKIID